MTNKEREGMNMANSFFPQRVDLTGRIQNAPIGNVGMPMSSMDIDAVDKTESSFKNVMSGLTNGLNQDLNAPEKLLKSVMAGDENVDIHDVMTAMAKAEISVNVATQVTTKVIQAYEKISQISV